MDVVNDYLDEQIRAATSRCLGQMGFTHTNTRCLDALSDVMKLYLRRLAERIHLFMEHCGRTEPALDDVEMAFKRMRVSVPELYEYMRQVKSTSPYIATPILPIPYGQSKNNIQSKKNEVQRVFPKPANGTCNDGTSSTSMTPLPDFSEATAYSLFLKVPERSLQPVESSNVKGCDKSNEHATDREPPRNYSLTMTENAEDATCNQSIPMKPTKRKRKAKPKTRAPKKPRMSCNSKDLTAAVNKPTAQLSISNTCNDVNNNKSAKNSRKCQEGNKTSSKDFGQAKVKGVPAMRNKIVRNRTSMLKIGNEELSVKIKKYIIRARLEPYSGQREKVTVPNKGQWRGYSKQQSAEKTSVTKKKQQPGRYKNSGPPFIALDLIRNSYNVLSACMAGRAFPIVEDVGDAHESTMPAQSNESTSEIVNEIFWRNLSGELLRGGSP